MPQQHVVDIALLGRVARRVFPGARSVSVEPASPGRLLVVHVEAQPGDLDRSFVIVSAVAGRSLASHGTDEQARRAVRAAGRDAALINAIEVEGFGWLRQDGLPGLRVDLGGPATAADRP